MSRAAVLAAPLVTLALVSCGGDSESGANGSATTGTIIDIRGRVTELVTPGSDGLPGGLAVEGEAEEDTRYSSAWVRMKDSTIIWRRSGEDKVAASTADLQPGMQVEARRRRNEFRLEPVASADTCEQAGAGPLRRSLR